MTLIIGIDPGSRLTGYGIISTNNDQLTFLDAGTIRTNSSDITERIAQIFAGVSRIVNHYQKYSNKPIQAAIEQVFMANNPDSALKLGQARGAAIAALTAQDLQVSEYTARQIKQAAVLPIKSKSLPWSVVFYHWILSHKLMPPMVWRVPSAMPIHHTQCINYLV